MAKKAMVERDLKRRRMAEKYADKRAELKAVAEDTTRPPEERFQARLKLAKLPRIIAGLDRIFKTGNPKARPASKAEKRSATKPEPEPALSE